jgi:hypothetical protein
MLGKFYSNTKTIHNLNGEIFDFIIPDIHEDVWLDYENSEEKIIIKKIYDKTFGTPKESVSSATLRYEINHYPIGNFINGFSNQYCKLCESDYIGDENSMSCELCMLNYKISNKVK